MTINKSYQVFAGVTVGTLAGGYFVIGSYAQIKYPPTEGYNYKYGSIYITKEGKKKVVLGYSGHHKNIKLDPKKPLFFAGKAIAQSYAKSYDDAGAVFVVIGNRRLSLYDLKNPSVGPFGARAGPYLPITTSGIERLEVELVEPEPVTDSNDLCKLAAIKRVFHFLAK